MQVILQQDVKKLGQKDDVVNVAEGYARNYLIPRGLAMEASKGKMKELEIQAASARERKKKIEQQARELGDQLENLKLVMPAKVGDAGKLFGAIGNKDIADVLKDQHSLTVDRRKIVVKSPIKALGQYQIDVKLHPKVQVQITVEVIPE